MSAETEKTHLFSFNTKWSPYHTCLSYATVFIGMSCLSTSFARASLFPDPGKIQAGTITKAKITPFGYARGSKEKRMTEKQQQCSLCPRACGITRETGRGYCRSTDGLEIASVTLHHGEEPVISGKDGICNIFFSGCNLRCVYCQNYQISRNAEGITGQTASVAASVGRITELLDRGIENIGFVSPSHRVSQVKTLLQELHRQGYSPIVVYNTNAYERVETLRSLEGLVDVYLPDFKYVDHELAARWSDALDYPEVACAALKEMYRQKGNRLFFTDSGKLSSGMIVRHLVLPGAVVNSVNVFRFLAEELSPRLAVSLMAQYNPTPEVADLPPLHRRITEEEYREVVREVEALGFENGWFQEFASAGCYNPDFTLPAPFDR
jgi:putative pyruvate formate lyase activating enzyme